MQDTLTRETASHDFPLINQLRSDEVFDRVLAAKPVSSISPARAMGEINRIVELADAVVTKIMVDRLVEMLREGGTGSGMEMEGVMEGVLNAARGVREATRRGLKFGRMRVAVNFTLERLQARLRTVVEPGWHWGDWGLVCPECSMRTMGVNTESGRMCGYCGSDRVGSERSERSEREAV